MSSPNPNTQSPPSSTQIDVPSKVVVPLPVITQSEDIYYYVFVRGSLYASDTQIFGLEPQEIQAISKKFNSPCKQVENGVMVNNPVFKVINCLAQLGYKVVSSCGESETIFTMQREV